MQLRDPLHRLKHFQLELSSAPVSPITSITGLGMNGYLKEKSLRARSCPHHGPRWVLRHHGELEEAEYHFPDRD